MIHPDFITICLFIQMVYLNRLMCFFFLFHFYPDEFSKQITKHSCVFSGKMRFLIFGGKTLCFSGKIHFYVFGGKCFFFAILARKYFFLQFLEEKCVCGFVFFFCIFGRTMRFVVLAGKIFCGLDGKCILTVLMKNTIFRFLRKIYFFDFDILEKMTKCYYTWVCNL